MPYTIPCSIPTPPLRASLNPTPQSVAFTLKKKKGALPFEAIYIKAGLLTRNRPITLRSGTPSTLYTLTYLLLVKEVISSGALLYLTFSAFRSLLY
jgi:hypothetical protein